jgi:exosome complex exonuclease RRP6
MEFDIKSVSQEIFQLSARAQELVCDLFGKDTSANLISVPVDIEYYSLTEPSFASNLKEIEDECFFKCNHVYKLIQLVNKQESILPAEGQYLKLVSFSNAEEWLDSYDDSGMEVLDFLFEKMDMALDNIKNDPYSKGSKLGTVGQGMPMVAEFSRKTDLRKLDIKLIHAQNIVRPQLRFADKIDNSAVPFLPKLKDKPNALVPLDKSILFNEESKK